ncbi:helicase-related protein [Faecalibaculum rodentium]|uniref:helicase-related protein n=1 Tax=Faecalibaculum rodentium TaxID=1702221 RepID=UPI001F590D69|nr:helicase-related protein [Faecalibaculum rodentium]
MKHKFPETTRKPAVPDCAGLACSRCGNTNPALFGSDHGIPYCRRCVAFSRLDAGAQPQIPVLKEPAWEGQIHLDFALTPFQQQASDQILDWLKQGESVFCYAACGSGKTEITFASIDWFLRHRQKVCFAISRRQVVLEIGARLQKAFPGLDVVCVCEGYTSVTDGDLIVCTTHQLYRYPGAFDLLILDELDAFPYRGNALLEHLAAKACRGVKLMLSATPDEVSLSEIEAGRLKVARLFRRPHGQPLPEPRFYLRPVWLQIFGLLWQLHRMAPRQVLVFVPRIRDGNRLSRLLGCPCIHSQSPDKDDIMRRFSGKEYRVLVSTTLLERGITVPSVQVIVLRADHPVFTMASLVQIFGRAGRSFDDPKGECLCFAASLSDSMRQSADLLHQMNESVSFV